MSAPECISQSAWHVPPLHWSILECLRNGIVVVLIWFRDGTSDQFFNQYYNIAKQKPLNSQNLCVDPNLDSSLS